MEIMRVKQRTRNQSGHFLYCLGVVPMPNYPYRNAQKYQERDCTDPGQRPGDSPRTHLTLRAIKVSRGFFQVNIRCAGPSYEVGIFIMLRARRPCSEKGFLLTLVRFPPAKASLGADAKRRRAMPAVARKPNVSLLKKPIRDWLA